MAAEISTLDPQTYAERLLKAIDSGWSTIANLDARAVTLNLLLSAVVVVFAIAIVWLVRRGVRFGLVRLASRGGMSSSLDSGRVQQAWGLTRMLLRVALMATALVILARIWGFDVLGWLASGAGGRLLRLAAIVLLASAAVEFAGFLINQAVEGVAARSGDARRAAQVRTLGPLLRGLAQGLLVLIGALTLFSELGLKIGPLLASAGVLGIAVGFGAQTLVKDFLTGLFLVVEDVVSLGDNVRIGDSNGVVEAMTLRTIRLRDTDGVLHVFPYSEAQVIHNRSNTFSAYVFDIAITYASDVDRALAVMGAVGEALQGDPRFAPLIVRPFEVMGVDKLSETGVLLKARVTTVPREQWRVGREYNRRIKQAFDEQGIELVGQKTPPPAPIAPAAPSVAAPTTAPGQPQDQDAAE